MAGEAIFLGWGQVVRAGAIVDNLGVTSAVTDEALASQMGTYSEVAQGLPQAT